MRRRKPSPTAAERSCGRSTILRGVRAVVEQARIFARRADLSQPVLVNGAPGIVSWLPRGRPYAIIGLTVRSGKSIEIDILADPVRLRRLDLAALKSSRPETGRHTGDS